jgi:hypothetical protein
MLEDLPVPIKNAILNNVNSFYERKNNTFSVTELLGCLRVSYFRRTNPKKLDINQAYAMYRGNIFDDIWCRLFRFSQVRCTYRCKNVPVTISGKYDFIDENGVLTDLKTVRTLYYIQEAKETHKDQVRFYCYCNSIEKAQILYVDFGDCKKIPVEIKMEDCLALLEKLETKATLLFWALRRGKPPEKTDVEAWMCKRCQFKLECKMCESEK